MMSFRTSLQSLSLPPSIAWLLSDVGESRGRQDLYRHQSPQVLKALREMALIQSVESSNRIEGVTVAADRLRPLVLGNTRPRDRSEEEIRGYRDALNEIHSNATEMTVTPSLIQHLHATIQAGSGDAGTWKRVDNQIIELRPGEAPRVRFTPTPASATPGAIEELCRSYHHFGEQRILPPLITTAALVFDFLCIHPFRDGNGRVSRLLTVLALYQHGYDVGRSISIERLIEESRSDYYEVLQRSSTGWGEGRHDLVPWLNYFLSIVRRAYVEFERRAGDVKSPRGTKTALVEAALEALSSPFTLADLLRACPGVSQDMVRRVLKRLQASGRVKCLGRGPGAAWQKEVSSPERG
jgi:Fic family protein